MFSLSNLTPTVLSSTLGVERFFPVFQSTGLQVKRSEGKSFPFVTNTNTNTCFPYFPCLNWPLLFKLTLLEWERFVFLLQVNRSEGKSFPFLTNTNRKRIICFLVIIIKFSRVQSTAYALDRFTKTFFWNFQNSRADLCYILI